MTIENRCSQCAEFYDAEFMRGGLCFNCSDNDENPFANNDEDSY